MGSEVAEDWYINLVNYYQFSELVLFVILFQLAIFLGFWVPSLTFFVIDTFRLFPQYKIHASYPEKDLLRRAILHDLIQAATFPAIVYFFFYPIWKGRILVPLPTLGTAVLHILFHFVWADGSFYWLHRMFHHRWFYRFHKQHHEFKATIGFAAVYASTLEDVLVNFPTTFIGPILLRSHPIVTVTFFFLRLQESVEEHSGYDVVWSPWKLLRNNDHHDFHHSHNVGAYGTFPFWDWIMGTDKAYNTWKEQQKNKESRIFSGSGK